MTPISSGLPPGWRFAALGDLGEWGGGGTPSKSRRSFWADGDIPWVSPKDMKFDAINGSLDKITQDAVENSSTNLYPVDTVLMVTRSAILYHTLPVAKTLTEVTINQDLKALVPNGFVDTDYLVAAIRAHSDQILRECRKAGTTVCSIEFPVLKAFELPVAPLNEQRRIVAKIEDLSARSRAAKEALDAIPPLLERFRQSVLAAAFRGDLTKQWREQNPNVEPASALLDRIRQERRHRWEEDYLAQQKAKGKTPKDDKWKEKYQEPEPVDTTDLPELPEGWCWVSMETLADSESNAICAGPFGTIFKAKDFRDDGVPIIFLRHVSPGECRLDYKPGYMDRKKWEELFQPYSVYGGELLVTKLGDPPGICAIFPPERAPAMVTPDVIKMKPNPNVGLNVYLMHYLNSDQARKFTFGAAYGVTRLRMNLTIFRAMPVPLAPLEEQSVMAESIDFHLAAAKSVLVNVEERFKHIDSLNQSILAKAFRGELVPQDPNDEPASVLLERIRAEREAKSAGQSGKKRKARK